MEDPPIASPSSGRKYLLGLVLLAALCLVGGYAYLLTSGHRDLQKAIAEADQLDPHWRMADLEAERPVLPDAENGIWQIGVAMSKLPRPWPSWPVPTASTDQTYTQSVRTALDQSFSDLPPQVLLNEYQVKALRAELERAKPALVEARKMADLPRGRYRLKWSRDYISTLFPHLDEVRTIANLLHYDARLRAHDLDIEGALNSCQATLNVGRALSDEPAAISQLTHIACRALAVRELERTLAQGQSTPTVLANLQRAFAEAAEEPLLLVALRGERASLDGVMEAIQMGVIKPSHFRSFNDSSPGMALELNLLRTSSGQRADMLKYMTRLVEIAKLPSAQQGDLYAQMEASLKEQPPMVRLLTPAYGKVAGACHRTQAAMRCAVVALAMERYRLEHQRWPDSLDALVPQYLPQIPANPFDGKPLRYRRCNQEVVVYSVGKDREDNSGNVKPERPLEKGTDLRFRLWGVRLRRQPPQPFQMPEPPPGPPPADERDQPEDK
jgi:hypothetical protein